MHVHSSESVNTLFSQRRMKEIERNQKLQKAFDELREALGVTKSTQVCFNTHPCSVVWDVAAIVMY